MQSELNEIATLRQMIEWGAARFDQAGLGYTHGMPEAIDEAVFLGLSALGLPHDLGAEYFDKPLTEQQKQLVLEFYQQRLAKKPASYITNRTWFAGLEFYVDERVLIPRSPFAELIANQFAPWVNAGQVARVLDLCTGSGCIAIACAKAFEHAEVVASDVSADALAVAEINIQNHGLAERLQLVQSDLFNDVPTPRYDLIVSNPPYVSLDEMAELNQEFEHEPALGLAAGEHGLDLVIPMLQQAREHLTDDGVLVVEVGYTWPVLQQALPNVPFMWLEFEYGGEGVFTLTAQQLEQYQAEFDHCSCDTISNE